MTDQQPHTPSLDQMRDLYVRHADQLGIASDHVLHAEFDRFLAAVEQRGAARGWDEGCKAGLDTGLTIGEVVMGLKPRPVPAPPENPYRADRLEAE